VLWGTMWTSRTLLGRTLRSLRHLEQWDGIQRVFVVPWEKVAEVNPPYGKYVRGEIARLGEHHPLVKTQYLLEEIDAEAGMFPEYRRALMAGTHPRRHEPEPGKRYVLTIDVAGETEEAFEGAELRDRQPRKDSTALTVFQLEGVAGQHHYLVQDRRLWTGVKHTQLFQELVGWVRLWGAEYVVVDATGVGAGLASFLTAALGMRRVRPFVFSAKSKSDLGWGLIAIIDSGRYRDYASDGLEETAMFWQQVEAAEYEIMPGPDKRMKWGVASPSVHDDLLISAALVAALEDEVTGIYSPSRIIVPEPVEWDSAGF